MSFHPYSKADQLKGHQKPKDTPKFKEIRYNRKRRKPPKQKGFTYHHNRKIPHWKQRGAITKNERAEMLRQYGEYCWVCGNPNYEIHHVREKGYGSGGRGKWRNLIPLCAEHHRGTYGVHGREGRELYDKIYQMHQEKYGDKFYWDEYDLWMAGHIENPTQELFEKFMEGEHENICEGNGADEQ